MSFNSICDILWLFICFHANANCHERSERRNRRRRNETGSPLKIASVKSSFLLHHVQIPVIHLLLLWSGQVWSGLDCPLFPAKSSEIDMRWTRIVTMDVINQELLTMEWTVVEYFLTDWLLADCHLNSTFEKIIYRTWKASQRGSSINYTQYATIRIDHYDAIGSERDFRRKCFHFQPSTSFVVLMTRD